MKRILFYIAIVLHVVCNADSVELVPFQQPAWYTAVANSSDTDHRQQYANGALSETASSHTITISTRSKTHHYHAPTYQQDVHSMNTEQLIQYFAYHKYTEDEILNRQDLFLSDDYLALAKKLPKYTEYVTRHYNEYRKFNRYTKVVGWFCGFYTPGFQKTFTRLYKECEEERLVQEARDTAYTQIKTAALDTVTRNYTVESNTITFAQEYDIAEADLIALRGNAYQHQLHSEFLEQLHEVHTISAYYALQPNNLLIDALGHGIAIGMEANRLQQPDTATTWANFGWKVLDIIEGVGDGILLCVENTVHCIQDPEYALKEFVYALGNITGYCARAIGVVAYWHELIEQGNALLVAQEMDDVATKIALCGALCADTLSTLSARDVAKNITHIALDMVITHKMLTLGSRLCSQLKPIVCDLIKNMNREKACVAFALQGVEEFGNTGKISFLMEEAEANSVKNAFSSIEQQSSKNLVQLSESTTEKLWVSNGGLIYGPDKKFGTRINHILQHTKPNISKLNHTVFTITGDELFGLIDFAWSKRGTALADDPGTYIIELEKIIGTQGEKAIKIVLIPGTNQLITAYPIKV